MRLVRRLTRRPVAACEKAPGALAVSVNGGERVKHLIHDSKVNTMCLISDDLLVAGCQDGTATLWDLEAEAPVQTFFHRRPVTSLAKDEQGALLAVATGEAENLWSDVEANGTVQVWEIATGVQVAGPWPHDGPVEKVEFGPNNTVYSASGSARQNTAVHPGAVRAWSFFPPENTSTDQAALQTRSWPNGVELASGVRFSHGKNVVVNDFDSHLGRDLTATASEDRTVRLWRTRTGSEASKPILLNGPAKAVAFHPSGEILATASQESPSSAVVRLWEVDSSYPTTPAFSCPGEVREIRFSPDGKALQALTEKSGYSWPLKVEKADELATVLKSTFVPAWTPGVRWCRNRSCQNRS